MEILFDSRSSLCKTPFGPVCQDELLTVHLYIKDAGETGVRFLLAEDGGQTAAWPMTAMGEWEGYHGYACSVRMEKTGLYFYRFSLQGNGEERNIYRNSSNHPVLESGTDWQLTCYSRDWQVDEDFCGRVMYQIFPDRFNRQGLCDTHGKLKPYHIHENTDELPDFLPNAQGEILNNDFFGGNLAGIMAKLEDLKNLGVGVIYLNPIFKAFSNHRYDTADYLTVDPLLGNNGDFETLCNRAHALGMRVILDGVFSHTGSDSVYFDKKNRFGGGAYHNPDSPYRSWYQFEEYPHRYQSWWGIETLPCVEEMNEQYQDFVLTGDKSVIRHWIRLGADGWRLDVADELPDSFISKLYQVVKEEKPSSLIIGEVWEDASNKISYGHRRRYLQGGVLDSVMNYVWRQAIISFVRQEISADQFGEQIMMLCEHYPPQALHTMMNALSTHDTPRILTVLSDEPVPETREERSRYAMSSRAKKLAAERLFLATFLQFTLPGSPCIYYGDEIGMEGFEDPFNRGYLGERQGDEKIRQHYQNLSQLKNRYPALKTGRLLPAFCQDGVYGYYRAYGTELLLCLVNVGEKPFRLRLENRTLLFKKSSFSHGEEILILPRGMCMLEETIRR